MKLARPVAKLRSSFYWPRVCDVFVVSRRSDVLRLYCVFEVLAAKHGAQFISLCLLLEMRVGGFTNGLGGMLDERNSNLAPKTVVCSVLVH